MKCQRYKCKNKATAYFASKEYCKRCFNLERQESKESKPKQQRTGKWWKELMKMQRKKSK